MGIGTPWKAALLLAVGAAGGGAALAVASVPDSTGVIHACVKFALGSTIPDTKTGNLRVIDFPTQTCSTAVGVPTREESIAWNTAGPPGQPGQTGVPGAPGRSVTIAGGNTLTIAGGQVITVGRSPTLSIAPVPPGRRAVATITFTGGVSVSSNILGFGFSAAGGGGAANSKLHDIQFTKHVDKASTKLFLACANGTHINKVTIHIAKAGAKAKQIDYTLSNVLIASAQLGSNGNGDLPTESFTLNYAKIQIKSS